MKNTTEKTACARDKIIELYSTAALAHEASCQALEKNMSQYLGSYEIDNSRESATTVRNITYEIIESEIDPDIPYPKATPSVYSEKREQNARNIELLCRAIRERLPFESLNDIDERYTYIYGGSVFYMEWDSEIFADGISGGVRLYCISPLDFIPEPGVCDVENMKYCFIRFTTTRSELIRKYGVTEKELELAECEYRYGEESYGANTMRVIHAFYRDEDGDVCKTVFSGKLILSDMPKCFSRKVEVCSRCGIEAGGCTCSGAGRSYYDTPTEIICNESGERVRVPYYMMHEFPIVIRQNTRCSESLFGLSDCERIRPQQQAINKVESRILKKLLRAGVTPVMPEDASFTLGNSIFGEIIRTRPGETLENYGKIDTTPDISQDIAEADRLYEQAKRVIGISDAFVGTDTANAESGYARELKISRAASRLETKKRMKYHAYSRLYRLIFEHYLAFADEPRTLYGTAGFLNSEISIFNRSDFMEKDADGAPYYSDAYLFSVDLNSGSEYTREALWERNLSNLESGTLGDKSSPETLLLYWQAQERAHYPFAKDNAEYFKALIRARSVTEAVTENQQESEK
ncbi:MAG: hypothetical protein J6Q85_03350 [Clostridia bacterium]|nr:hypothetical protein [Clostridia bacterium]